MPEIRRARRSECRRRARIRRITPPIAAMVDRAEILEIDRQQHVKGAKSTLF
ncbi:hypothetical protein [Robbsia sp. KACC 23696]|uniref:hypothetical protein n=1 Tax=Robbsia sp. KACC 23696 TaxID=3149231 RepID=UPI00325B9FB3